MSTVYTLSIGYISGYSHESGREDEAWQTLVGTIERIKHDPERIVAEARRLGAPEICEQGCCTLQSVAEAYQRQDDGTLTINQHERYAIQIASGDRTRKLKELVRRAFCRLVIEDMHKEGIEVNLQVS